MTLLSRILGFVRDAVIARLFGAGLEADAFFVAFKIPNLFRRLVAEGSFSQAFVPVLAEERSERGDPGVKDLVDAASGSLAVVLLLIVLAGVVAAPVFILLFAPGFKGESAKLALAADLLRVIFPYLLFVSLSALAGGVLNVYGRFAVPAFTPVLLNLAMIGAAIGLAPHLERPIMGLAIGVVIGGFGQLALQYAALWHLGFRPRPVIAFAHAGVRKILRLMGPAVFGSSVAQLNMMLDTIIASFLVTGSVSWLYYSDRLVEFPLGVFGIALGTVILPALSARHTAGSPQAFSATLDWALRWVFLIGTPSALGLAVLALPMLSALFQYGALTEHDVAMSARSLVAFAFGLLAFILIKILAPGYYARQDTRTPVRIGIIAMISNMVMNLVLIFPLAHAGLALATTLAAYLNAWMLFRGLQRDGIYSACPGWALFLVRVMVATGAMVVVLWWLSQPLSGWAAASAAARCGRLALVIVAGMGTYFGVLAALGLRPRDMAMREADV